MNCYKKAKAKAEAEAKKEDIRLLIPPILIHSTI